MHTLAIVGCGNIGSRLLQSASRAPVDDLHIWAVEPHTPARELAAERFHETSDRGHTLHAVDSVSALPPALDLLVVATRAHTRMQALDAALDHTAPRAVLLEKTLWTKLSDYGRGLQKLRGAPVFVNTTRNIWPGYLALRDHLSDTPLHYEASGSDWNLASNAIHFLSVAEFLARSHVTGITLTDTLARNAKRDGYRDLTGTLHAKLEDGSTVTLRSHTEPGDPLTVTLTQGDRTRTIREGAQEMDGQAFPMLHASQIGDELARLVTTATSGLPTLASSTRLHETFLHALAPHVGGGDPDLIMVT